jgi:hypothetical protein
LDTVKLLPGGIDVNAVGMINNLGDEVELVGYDASCPSDGNTLVFTVVIEKLYSFRFDGYDFRG